LVLFHVGVEDELEFGVAFVVEDEGFGEHAVLGGVLRGALFAFGGFGTFRFGAVLAGGLDLFFGGHVWISCEEGSGEARGFVGLGWGMWLRRCEIIYLEGG
jgi:hypothetical protein